MTPKKRRSNFVWSETNNRCVYCNKETKESERSVDHIYPKSKGGTWSLNNLVPACKKCNVKRGVIFPPSSIAHPEHQKYLKKKEINLGIIINS